MSTNDVYEYKQTEYQDLIKVEQAISGTGIVPFTLEGIKIAGYNINLFDDAVGTTQLVLDTDYTLQDMDQKISTAEGQDIYGSYQVINAAYQAAPLFLDIRCVGGYTKYTGGYAETVSTTTTITPESFGHIVYVENGVSDVVITINDAARTGDKVTVYALGTGTVTVSGTGFSEVLTEATISFSWDGTEYTINELSSGYYETIYKIDDQVTPTGNVPVGWSTSPPVRVADEIIYASNGFKNGSDILVGVWSTPTQWTGDKGDQGIQGLPGDDGTGVGVPAGGTAGQVLTKDTTTDYDTSWQTTPDPFPIGAMMMYDGASWVDNSTMPGWYACIAANSGVGCPDLENIFIKGSAVANIGDTGGSNTHTLDATEIPSHTHSIAHNHGAESTGSHVHGGSTGWRSTEAPMNYYGLYATVSGATVSFSDAAQSIQIGKTSTNSVSVDLPAYTGNSDGGSGGGTAHNNEPAYYKLIYIRKCV